MDKEITITDANFENEVLKSDKPVFVDFWAAWCGPCRLAAPIVEEIAKEYDGRLKVGKCDIDANQETAMKFGVTSIPTFILFKGGKEVNRSMGVGPKDRMIAIFNEFI